MSIDKAITYLKKKAPKGEFLAYINSKEAAMLKKAGGSGELVNGIPSYRSKAGMESKARSSSYSSPSSSPSPRGPQELGTSTRTKNRITAPAPTTRIGGKTYNVTPETRGDRDRATLKQQLMRQPLGGNKIDRFGNTKKPFFPQGGGGIGQLLGSLIGFALGIPGLGLAFSKQGMNFINEKFRGTNPDGSIRTQAEYKQSMDDKRAQNKVAKLLEAKNRGFNQIGFGDFTAKTVDFTPNQQALLDNLIAQGYGPASLDAANPQFQNDLGNPNMDLSGIQTIQQLAQPNINAFPGMGVAPQPLPGRFIEPLSPNLDDPVQNQVGNIDNIMAKSDLAPEFQDMAIRTRVSPQDLARYATQKDLIDKQDYDSAMNTTFMGSEMTPYEYENMRKGNITQPGVYPKGYFDV